MVSEIVTISNPQALVINSATPTDVSCFGDANGTITVDAVGGQGTLQYSLDGANYQASNLFEGLASGNYQVFVKDELDCSVSLADVFITQPNELTAQAINIQPESCLGQANGAFDISIAGGTLPYSTKLNDGAFVENQTSFTDLAGGTSHVVIVRDASGCETTVNVTIDAGIELNLQLASEVNCTNYLSTVTATVASQYAINVQYSLNSGALQASNIFTDLQTGTYTINAHHSNGCVVSETISVTNPTAISIDEVTVNSAVCYGDTNGEVNITASGGEGTLQYSLDGNSYQTDTTFSNLSAGNYTVYVIDDLNCTPVTYDFTINENTEIVVQVIDKQQNICFGDENKGSFQIEIQGGQAPYKTSINNGVFIDDQVSFSDLDQGQTYTVTVRDALNCEASIDIEIESPINLDLTLETEYSCDNNATIFALTDSQYDGQVTYTINGQNPQTDGIFTDLPTGEYVIEATHEKGCFASQTIVIKENIAVSLAIDTSTINKLIANASGGEAPYTYSFDGGDFNYDNEFTISETRMYTVAVKDSRGCIVEVQILGELLDIEIPNFFTPNGNGKHDTWYPNKVEDYHDIEVQIYDRYSRLLKTFRGVNNAWDGNYNNRPLPSGDYWYVIYYNQTPNKRRKLMGNFTLYR